MSDSKHMDDLNMMDSILYKEILPAISKQISSVAFELSVPIREKILVHKGNLYKKNICNYIDSQIKFFCSEAERTTAKGIAQSEGLAVELNQIYQDDQNPKPSVKASTPDHQAEYPIVPVWTSNQELSKLIASSKN